MLIERHTVTLPEGVPEMVHLLPAGTFSGADGRGPFRVADADAVIDASMAGDARLPIDENHSIDLTVKTGAPSPARGHIVSMERRDDGIWGKVEWNKPGREMLENHEYRFISPTFQRRPDGTIISVLRAALTNSPNLPQLTSLHHQETQMDLTALRAALGLPETADDAAILVAATAAGKAVSTHAAQITAIATAARSQATTADGLVVELQTRHASAASIETMAATITTLQTELSTMKASGAQAAAVTFVDGAIKAGKPIVPLRDFYVERHAIDPEGIETIINALPSINGGTVVLHANNGGGGAGGGRDTTELSASDKMVVAKMGLDPAKFLAAKKAKGTPSDGRAA